MLNHNFYNVDRKMLEDIKPKSMRLSRHFLKFDYTDDTYLKATSLYIINSFYSMFNYITGEYVPNLSFEVASMESSCAMNKNSIKLGGKILSIEGYTQDFKVDALYGVMLHEMYHKRFTNKDLSEICFGLKNVNDLYQNAMSQRIQTFFPTELFREIFNILEDRRIERLGLNEFPGYVFYFDRLRELAYNLHEQKEHKEQSERHVVDFLMYEILIPELADEFINKIKIFYKKKTTILKTIESIREYINKNKHLVYSDKIIDILQATSDILKIIPQDIRKKLEKSNDKFDGILEIPQGISGEPSKTESEAQEACNSSIEELSKEYTGNQDNFRKEKIELFDVHEKEYNEVYIYSPICKSIEEDIYREAKKMSTDFARRLGFIASRLNDIHRSLELDEGEIDEEQLYAIGFSNYIFFEEEDIPGFEFDLGILIDESGSMAGLKRTHATITALSCILGATGSQHVNMFVYGHSYGRHRETDTKVEMYEYYNSKKNITNWKNVFATSASGGNADGYAIAKMGEIMIRDSRCKNKIMIVISDGVPAASNYSGDKAERHVRSVVTTLELKGIEVIQICIDNVESSHKMFKNYIPFDNLGDYMKQFSKFLQTKLTKFSNDL